LFSISTYSSPSRKGLRSFGLIVAAGFFVVGMMPPVFRHASPSRLALMLSLAFAATGILVPGLLRYVHRVWMFLGNVLGWVNSKIILGVLFYLIVTPVRIVIGVLGKDPMNRKFDPAAESYRVACKPREASHMRHQF
jgi:hypothetical protein